MKAKRDDKLVDEETAAVLRALKRAYQSARDEAIRTHTCLIVKVDGKMVRFDPSLENPSIENE